MTARDQERAPILVAVHPGAGIVHRHGDALLVIPAFEQGQLPAVRRLLDICARDSDLSGRGRARAVAALLTEADPDDVPGFALMLGTEANVSVLAQGAVQVTARGLTEQVFSGADSLAWVERRIEATLDYLRVTASGLTAIAETASVPLHLESGTVPGSGVTLHRRQVAPPALPRAEPRAEPPVQPADRLPVRSAVPPGTAEPVVGETVARPVQAFESVLLRDVSGLGTPARSPLPLDDVDQPEVAQRGPELVEGIDCPAGHFNDPRAQSCRVCSVAVDTGDQRRVNRSRPALGVLVTDNGSVFSVDGDYVIGRAPERDEAVLLGRARALVLRDVGQSVSRVHAYLSLDGWQVYIIDRGSANGTFVTRAGQVGPWERVPGDRQLPIGPGTRLKIGGRQLLFERYLQGNLPGSHDRGV